MRLCGILTGVMLAGLAVLTISPSAAAQNSDLNIVHTEFVPPNYVRALVRVSNRPLDQQIGRTPDAGDFSLEIVTKGQADISKVVRWKPSSIHTVVLLDRSGSFESYMDDARAMAAVIANRLTSADTAQLYLFAAQSERFPVRGGTSKFGADLSKYDQAKRKVFTRLNHHIDEAVKMAAADAAAGAFKRVIVLTDGAEEGRYAAADVIAAAQKLGVQINAWAFPLKSTRQYSHHLDTLKRITAYAGGDYVEFQSGTNQKSKLERWYDAPRNYLLVEAEVRCLDRAFSSVDILVRYAKAGGQASITKAVTGITGTSPFDCAPPCEQNWQSRNAKGECVANRCGADIECAPDGVCSSGLCAKEGITWWYLLVAALLVLLVVLLSTAALLMAKRGGSHPPPKPPEPPPPPPPPPPSCPEPPLILSENTPSGIDVISKFPETHLVVLSGTHSGDRLRLTKPEIQVGAAPDSDVVLTDATVSGRHAKITLHSTGNMWVVDLKSRNTTTINGVEIPPHQKMEIQEGDRLGFGPEAFVEVYRPGPIWAPPEVDTGYEPDQGPDLPTQSIQGGEEEPQPRQYRPKTEFDSSPQPPHRAPLQQRSGAQTRPNGQERKKTEFDG